jgi:uncharacterized protein YyaL (SSP411 family)
MSQLQQAVGGHAGERRGAGEPRRLGSEARAEGTLALQPGIAEHTLQVVVQQLEQRFDARLGGFGGAPK